MIVGRVGRKGELYVPEEIRKNLDLKPGDEVVMDVRGDEIVIRKGRDIFDVLMDDPVAKVSVEDMEKVRRVLSKSLGV